MQDCELHELLATPQGNQNIGIFAKGGERRVQQHCWIEVESFVETTWQGKLTQPPTKKDQQNETRNRNDC